MDAHQQKILDALNVKGKLPTPKGIALELINLTAHDGFSTQDVVRLISGDPALSLRVIKAANALIISSVRSVVTISDAVTVLGIRAIRHLVMAISLVQEHQQGPCKHFDYGYFWSRSLLTGVAIRQLARLAKLAAEDELFVIGLLADIGKLAMTTADPERFGTLLQMLTVDDISKKFQQEHVLFGFDQGEASAAMLAEMNFPLVFQEIVQTFQRSDTTQLTEGSRAWKLMMVLQVASLIARISLALPSQRDSMIKQLKVKSAEVAIEESAIFQVADACAKDWPQWASLFNIPARTIPSFVELFDNIENDSSAPVLPQGIFSNHDYKMRVLVVEDDRLMLSLMSKLLTAAGHQVKTASNGIEALQVIENEHPQLVITDWMMPKMDGITLCSELRKLVKNNALYLIVVTSHESADKLVEAFEAGADDYLIKPIIPKILYARLRAAQRVIKLQEELATERAQMLRFSTELSETNERLHHLSLTDALTDLPNRRLVMDRLAQEWAASERNDRPVSCMMLDIDHFKSINDTYGHQMGDEALKVVSNTLRKAARAQDVVSRYGGEEFLILCPDTTPEMAVQIAERMRHSIAKLSLNVDDQRKLKMTVSIGVSGKTANMKTMDALLTQADVNLYAAKHGGRNRTIWDCK